MRRFAQKDITLTVPIEGEIRTLQSEIHYHSDIVEELLIVEIGLKTDLGSIPSLLRGIFPNDGKAMFGYILHDNLYKYAPHSRNKCDDILEEAMKDLGVSWWRRKSVRAGLKVGGWHAWNKHRKKDKDS